jgi:hypothetical protein
MIQKVVNKKKLQSHDEIQQNRQYWLSRPPEERIAAVEFYRRQVYGECYPQRLQKVAEASETILRTERPVEAIRPI